jgi:hypothetical protein
MTSLRLALVCLVVVSCNTGGGGGPATATPGPSASRSGSAVYPGWNDRPVGKAQIIPILVSSDLAKGPNRFLLSVADKDNRLIASPDVALDLRFYDLATDAQKPALETDADFLWVVENERGLYRTRLDFPRAGDWGVEVVAHEAGQADRTARVVFPVREKGATPGIGAEAPTSETPTATDRQGIEAISTDDDPDPLFYRSSVRDAVGSGKPAVIVFATPEFCTSQVCGPTLDIVKAVAPRFEDRVEFVHVEVFTNLDHPDQLQVVPAVSEWGLPSEPWVFVVDSTGHIADKFEGVVGPDELTSAIDAALEA